jgi:hypothetical protein
VLGGLSSREKLALTHCRERVSFAYARLCRLCVERKFHGGIPVGEPVLSRIYQVRHWDWLDKGQSGRRVGLVPLVPSLTLLTARRPFPALVLSDGTLG